MAEGEEQSEYPIAVAVPFQPAPIADAEIKRLVQPYDGQSVAESYLGPGWVDALGVACVIVIARDRTIPQRVAAQQQCGFVTWRWPDSPSAPFSLGLSLPDGSIRRGMPRWMRAGHDSVVQAIRKQQRFLVAIASVQGESSGWFDADYRRRPDGTAKPDAPALRHIFEFPVPGIPFSNVHTRFDPTRRERFNDTHADEIPLWAEPVSDFWSLNYGERTPWAADLQPRDHAKAVWGREALKSRRQAAAKIQLIIDSQRFDGVLPHFDPLGVPQPRAALPKTIDAMALSHKSIGKWLAAVAGPAPDAQLAHEAVVTILREPAALFVAMYGLVVKDVGDRLLAEAILTTFTTALLDSRITNHGTLRPSLVGDNVNRTIDLFGLPIDLDAPPDAVQSMWLRITTDWQELFRTHEFLESSDFPMELVDLRDAFRNITLDGDWKNAEVRLQVLLQEAQEARQWSIPWGARVQLQLGPFRMLRIFELDGDFRCLFINDQQRYFQVSLNLATNPPDADSTIIPSKTTDSSTNQEAEAIVKLIAAAIVRDFIVVEERESVFHARPTVNRSGGREIQSVIYLPRVRYTASAGMAIPPTGEIAARVRHQVSAHLRRSDNASTSQRILALRYGLQLPQGFTFVRPFERGGTAHAEGIRVYRSRSASRMMFDELTTSPGSRPAWFDFEKDCKRLLEQRGLEVVHQAANRGGDGGVDLYASDRGGRNYVVQCKCWSEHRVVRPATIRKLAGAIRLADRGGDQASRGILITTSTFSAGAVTTARELGIELIDGSAFVLHNEHGSIN